MTESKRLSIFVMLTEEHLAGLAAGDTLLMLAPSPHPPHLLKIGVIGKGGAWPVERDVVFGATQFKEKPDAEAG